MKLQSSFITLHLFKAFGTVTALAALILLGAGCSSVDVVVGNIRPVDSKSAETVIPPLEKRFPEWKRMKENSDSPDAEWQSDQTAAIISVNSACRENFDGAVDLKGITNTLLSQWKNLEILSERNLTISGHPALETTAKGTYLKRERKFQTVTVKSSTCIYDLIFLSPIQTFAQDLSVFQYFRDSLVLK